MSPLLEVRDLTVPARLSGATFRIAAGEFIGLVGPNGSGKSTLMRAALGLVPARGASSILALPISARPRHVAYLAQQRDVAWPISVLDIVALGAEPVHGRGTAAVLAARRVIARLGLEGFAGRRLTELSGGETAKVLLARALAQDAPLLLADEPCAALDPDQSLKTARELLREAEAGRSVMASLHDLALAAAYCTRLIVMEAGRIVADGPPEALAASGVLARVFSISLERVETARGPRWVVGEP